MLRFTSAAATARRLPCIVGRASVSVPVSRPSATSLRYRQNDYSSLRTFASSSDANEGTNGGAESPSSSSAAASAASSSSEQSSSTTPSLSRESRQSETQAINLRAIKQSDQIGAAAEQLKKRLGEKPSSSTPDAALAAARKLVLGGNDSEEKWRELDEKFNEYPDLRTFKGIGEAGADPGLFKRAVVAAVESVVGPVDEAKQVSVRDSSGGKYVSVTVGPVTVNSGDEVVQVYAAMRETAGNMLKFYL